MPQKITDQFPIAIIPNISRWNCSLNIARW